MKKYTSLLLALMLLGLCAFAPAALADGTEAAQAV